jgi:hypothetical protein
MMRRLFRLGIILLMMSAGSAASVTADISSDKIPPELARWRSWVLHGHEEPCVPQHTMMVPFCDASGRRVYRWRSKTMAASLNNAG